MLSPVTITVNGVKYARSIPARLLLVDFIRDTLGMTGTHQGCSFEGVCGACTIHLDGEAVKSCMLLAVQANSHEITTIEGVGTPEQLHPVQIAFRDHHALQCGFCTSGMIMNAIDFLKNVPDPSDVEIRQALIGNICRCTGYQNIVAAIRAAAREIREQG